MTPINMTTKEQFEQKRALAETHASMMSCGAKIKGHALGFMDRVANKDNAHLFTGDKADAYFEGWMEADQYLTQEELAV
jgi:hypothetical protein